MADVLKHKECNDAGLSKGEMGLKQVDNNLDSSVDER